MTRNLSNCRRCGATLGPWEKSCGCDGRAPRTIRESIYATACASTQPLHARDFVRLGEHDHGLLFSEPTALVTLSTDARFCWSGRGLYGLYRHGPLPGPRNLEQATRLILVSAGRPLAPSLVDFCLKRFGYRYNVQSLRNAVSKSADIYREDGFWHHGRGDDAEWGLLHDVEVIPKDEWGIWDPLKADIRRRVARCADELRTRLASAADLRQSGLDWDATEGDRHGQEGRFTAPRAPGAP
jgi:hypothetical protein